MGTRRAWVRCAMVLLAGMLAGCGGGSPVESEPPRETQLARTPSIEDRHDAGGETQVTVSEMDFYMHDLEAADGVRRKPTLWVHASEGEMSEDRSWALTDARAIIYREGEEDIRLESASGRFDGTNKVALLDGGVRVRAGVLNMETESIRWDNATQIAETTSSVLVSDKGTALLASGAKLEPRDGTITLRDVSGTMSLGGGSP